MAKVRVRDDAVWFSHIEGGGMLQERSRLLRAGEKLELEVDGVVGTWERMRDGKDGRPTFGIKPVDDMKRVWARFRQDPERVVEIWEIVSSATYLSAVAETLSEWNSPEDEAAYGGL